MEIVQVGLWILEVYSAVGLIFGLVFVTVGIQRVDEAAKASGVGLRLMLLPGCILFWPKLASIWLRGRGLPVESSAHRRAARESSHAA